MNPTIADSLPFLGPLAIIAVLMLRNSRGRKLRAERLWIYPAIMIVLGLAVVVAAPPTEFWMIGALALVTALGALIGWYRGKLTKIELNPETHEFTSRASPAGMILILGVFALRYGLRSYMGEAETTLHLSAALFTDALLLFTIAILAVARLEIWLRCENMIAAAKAPPG